MSSIFSTSHAGDEESSRADMNTDYFGFMRKNEKSKSMTSGLSFMPNSSDDFNPLSWSKKPRTNPTLSIPIMSSSSNPGTPQSGVTASSCSKVTLGLSDTSNLVNSTCYVSLLEGRGSARGEIGIASICTNNPTLVICQLSDTTTYVRTIAKLALFNPIEILFPITGFESGGGLSKLHQEIEDNLPHTNIIQIQRRYFNEAKGLQVVKRLCAPEYSAVELLIGQKYYGLAAVSALIKYVENVQNVFYASNSLRVEYHASMHTTMIDVETSKNIELLTSSLNVKSGNSLYGFLNHCSTPGGNRLLRANLFQPPMQGEMIEDRLDVIQELIAKPGLFHLLQSVLGRFCDVDQLLSLCVVVPKRETLYTFEKRLNNVIGLKQALELIESLKGALQGAETKILCEFETQLFEPAYNEVLEKVTSVIHENARIQKGSGSMKLQRCFAVKCGLNGLLDVARRTYCETVDDIEEMVAILAEEHNLPMRVGHNGSRGYHVQIHAGGTKVLRNVDVKDLPKSFLQVQKNKNVIAFTTEDIIQADQRSQEALKEITVMSNGIIEGLLQEIRGSIGCLYKFSEIVSTLDVLVSFAEVSQREDFVRPSFGNSLIVQQGRHPILEHMSSNHEVVPNDIIATVESTFHVLTGANMSGKSTYLKQILLLQIMSQVGCYVPAKYASFRISDTIFSRLGTGDSIECNASTFTLEMKEMAYILSNATSNSLVVIDELGRGTSTEEGIALSWAISEKLIGLEAFCFLATHFELLTKLEDFFCTCINYHFLTDRRIDEDGQQFGLTYTHKLAKGFVESENYGIELAKTTALPNEIVDDAKLVASSLSSAKLFFPEVSGHEMQRINTEKLYRRLLVIAQDPTMSGADLKAALKILREQFSPEEEIET